MDLDGSPVIRLPVFTPWSGATRFKMGLRLEQIVLKPRGSLVGIIPMSVHQENEET